MPSLETQSLIGAAGLAVLDNGTWQLVVSNRLTSSIRDRSRQRQSRLCLIPLFKIMLFLYSPFLFLLIHQPVCLLDHLVRINRLIRLGGFDAVTE